MSTPSDMEPEKQAEIAEKAETVEDVTDVEKAPEVAESTAPKAEESEGQRFFKTKKIRFGPIEYRIVTQNLNGPCPLIALINALVLKGKITISDVYAISATDLLTFLSNIILSRTPPENDEKSKEIFENNLQDVMNIMPSLVNGLDVNVKFSSVDTFEFTPALSLFDLVQVNLYHVWLPDPQFPVLFDLVKKLNYNELVEKMCEEEDGKDETQLLRSFYEESISQITFHGLATLMEKMNDGELAVVFQNNHFATILKRRDEIFKLVSDEGLADEPSIIWETFNSVDGDSIFVNADFGNFKPIARRPSTITTESYDSSSQRIDDSPIEEAIEALEIPSSVPIPSVEPSVVTPSTVPQTARTTTVIHHQNLTPRQSQERATSSTKSSCILM